MKKLTLLAAAFALAAGSAYAADKDKSAKTDKNVIEQQQEKGGALNNETSFRVMDKNNDGYLSKAEAAGNKDLAKRFAEADSNNDGKLSRMEYLKVMAKIDTNAAANKVSKSTDGKPDNKAASGGTKQK
jgi:Ca2+-binding EF-hand superfamily protein